MVRRFSVDFSCLPTSSAVQSRFMKIYTKTGDEGMTGLFGGGRVRKDTTRIEAYGDVDELNAVLGLVRCESRHELISKALMSLQEALFIVGAQLASPKRAPNIEVITSAHVDALERQIDVISENLPQMRNFILPGGGKTASYLHLARTVCRRAERRVVTLAGEDKEAVDKWVVIYMNRLSDYLFILARLANQLDGVEDIPWLPTKK